MAERALKEGEPWRHIISRLESVALGAVVDAYLRGGGLNVPIGGDADWIPAAAVMLAIGLDAKGASRFNIDMTARSIAAAASRSLSAS
jgi:hypothetical protein